MTQIRTLMASAAIVFCLFTPASSASSDAEMARLYEVKVAVTGENETEQREAYRTGARKVLIRLTGRPKLGESERVMPIIERASDLIAEHSYENRVKEAAEADEEATPASQRFLRMRFDQAKVREALDKIGIPIWQGKRPTIAVWLGVRQVRDRFILGREGEQGQAQREALKEAADSRGFSVVFPEAKQDVVTYRDIERRQWSLLLGESRELGAETVLYGTLEQAGDEWDAQWVVAGKGAYSKWAQRGVTMEKALNGAIDHVMAAHARQARYSQKD